MERQKHNLFGNRIIKSFSFQEQELIADILHLHCKDKNIELDATYSIGKFYRQKHKDKQLIKPPIYKFDLSPQLEDVKQSCSTNLPLQNDIINVMMFDPPFMFEKRIRENNNIQKKRFTMYENGFDELKKHYIGTLKEAYRILKKNGILIFKCQDFTDSKTTLTHCLVYQWATIIGFYAKDLFILLSKGAIANKNLTQRHARKYHSYFFVFVKK